MTKQGKARKTVETIREKLGKPLGKARKTCEKIKEKLGKPLGTARKTIGKARESKGLLPTEVAGGNMLGSLGQS